MADRFEIKYESKGVFYSASVELIQVNDMEPGYYRVWTQDIIIEIEPVFNTDLDISWRAHTTYEQSSQESTYSNLIWKIGKAIEQHDVTG